MNIHGEIPKARGAVLLITTSEFAGMPRIDAREWVEERITDPDSRRPTKSGINLPVRKLPILLAALKRAEAEAIQCGHLKDTDYTAAGMTVPHELARVPKSPARPRLVKAG